RFQRPLRLELHGRAGQRMTILARDEMGHHVEVTSAMVLTQATKQPLTADRLREQLGRLGGTPFQLAQLESCLEGELILPVSELNRLRREIVGQLESLRRCPKRWTLNDGSETAAGGVSSGQ